MPLDLMKFSEKLRRITDQLLIPLSELSGSTGIAVERIQGLLTGKQEPTGDEVLILADFLKCDYNFFISNEKVAPIEQTDILFRRHGKDFSKEDRMAVQEVLFMAECEHFLMKELGRIRKADEFYYISTGDYYKGHAEEAAQMLRRHIGYQDHEIRINVFDDIRKIGFHVFKRRLSNSKVSGISIRHPVAGRCILVNYNEDTFRQRFTLLHEAAHGIFDLSSNQDIYVSYETWDRTDLREVRANSFASNFLIPRSFICNIQEKNRWDEPKFRQWCSRLNVNPEPLSIALKDAGLIGDSQQKFFKGIKIAQSQKTDSELPVSLSLNGKNRKLALLQKGLSDFYVKLCFDAYRQNIISLSRVAEILLIDENTLYEIMDLYEVSFE